MSGGFRKILPYLHCANYFTRQSFQFFACLMRFKFYLSNDLPLYHFMTTLYCNQSEEISPKDLQSFSPELVLFQR